MSKRTELILDVKIIVEDIYFVSGGVPGPAHVRGDLYAGRVWD